MANYPSPCAKCERKHNCTYFRNCQPWLTRYKYRQKQINAFAKKLLSGSGTMPEIERDQSPCKTCTRVKDPYNCGQKGCNVWREWYIGRQNQINAYAEKHLPDYEERMEKGIHYDDED